MAALEPPSEKQLEHSLQMEKIEAGLLGKFFGKGEESKKNITAAIVIALILGGILFGAQNFKSSLDYWKIIIPVVTLGLGYLFGKK